MIQYGEMSQWQNKLVQNTVALKGGVAGTRGKNAVAVVPTNGNLASAAEIVPKATP